MNGVVFKYLIKEIVKGIALTASIISALVIIVDYVELSRRMDAEPNVTAVQVLHLTVLKMPTMVEQLLPFMVLFGVMWVMFRLNRRGELVAMRVASMSAWQLAKPALLIAMGLGAFGIMVLNPVAAHLKLSFETKRMTLLEAGDSTTPITKKANWFRETTKDGVIIIRAQDKAVHAPTLYDLTFFYYRHQDDDTPVIERRIDAKSADLSASAWQLTEAREITPGRAPVHYATLSLPTKITQAAITENAATTSSLSVYNLPRSINGAKRAGMPTKRFQMQLYQLLSLPFILSSMALIGAAFAFKLVRLGGTLRLVLLAGATGFGFYFAVDFMQTLGTTSVLPPIIAAGAIPLFVFFAGIARVIILEDG